MKLSQSAGTFNLKSKGAEFPQSLAQKKNPVMNKLKKNWLIYNFFFRKVYFYLKTLTLKNTKGI